MRPIRPSSTASGSAASCSVFLALFALVALLPAPLAQAAEPYRRPPEEIVRILEAPPTPFVSVSPDGQRMLLLERESMPPISELARPMLKLAGYRIDPRTNGRHGVRQIVGLTVKRLSDGVEERIVLPPDVSVGFPQWAPDSRRFAFTITRDNGVELWVGDAARAGARMLVGPRLNAAAAAPFTWSPDGASLLALLVPRDRGPAPEAPRVPEGPIVQETQGGKAPVRTYQDLLRSPHDEALFEHYFTAQLARVDASTGALTRLGEPGLFLDFSPSPDGRYLLVERVHRPYSYLVPASRFPTSVEVWSSSGKLVSTLVDMPLRERIPIGGVQTGPRGHRWIPTEDATLLWVEALDGGDPKRQADRRDALFTLQAPFAGKPRRIAALEDRFSGAQFLEGSSQALVSEYDRDERWTRTWLLDARNPEAPPRLLFERNVQDRYADPGAPMTTQDQRGQSVVRVHDGAIFLQGQGATPQGDRPFLSRFDLASGATEQLWRNEGASYETVVALLSDDAQRLLTRHETPTTPPNYFVRDLAANSRRAITHFDDPAPILRKARKELVTYQREDGVTLSATLYLPPDYKEGERRPLFVWAYPFEYNDSRTAGQVRGSPYRFTTVRGASHLFLLLAGYVVMDNAAMPVVGADPNTVNDTFIEQIVANARAAIDYAASRGVADPERVGVGGHSYGAFMTANLLAHCDLFKAGIARSGAYNRTLTPFGFQSERRTLWEAPEVYFKLSPFMHAHRINEPLLLIHGQNDNNSGTFPIQSERMYHAIKGNGGVARLVMLPYESHGYRGAESILHTIAEMIDWLDEHVKNASGASATAR